MANIKKLYTTFSIDKKDVDSVEWNYSTEIEVQAEVTVQVGSNSTELDVEVDIDVEDNWDEITSVMDDSDTFVVSLTVSDLIDKVVLGYIDQNPDCDSAMTPEERRAAFLKIVEDAFDTHDDCDSSRCSSRLSGGQNDTRQ